MADMQPASLRRCAVEALCDILPHWSLYMQRQMEGEQLIADALSSLLPCIRAEHALSPHRHQCLTPLATLPFSSAFAHDGYPQTIARCRRRHVLRTFSSKWACACNLAGRAHLGLCNSPPPPRMDARAREPIQEPKNIDAQPSKHNPVRAEGQPSAAAAAAASQVLQHRRCAQPGTAV